MWHETNRAFSLGELATVWAPYTEELLVHDPDGPGECLVRRGELLVERDSLDPVVERVRRWVDSVRHDDLLPLARVRLRSRERDSCVDIARDLSGHGVAANHVHVGSPVLFGTPVLYGTGADAESAPPVRLPGRQPWEPAVTVGVLDTGLDPHPWFARQPWFRAVPEELDADDDSGQDRQAGHGTFVAGVVLQHAPGVAIRAHRVLSSLGMTDDVTVAAGLRALRRTPAAEGVVLLTAGCYTADDRCPPILRAELAGYPVVVAAAGNQSSRRPFWPAALPGVLGVAATDSRHRLAEFSNFGAWVDSAAPGIDVVSSYVWMRPAADRGYGFARWSGTSFAAPRVAAEAASALHRGHTAGEAADAARHRWPNPLPVESL